MTEQLLRRVAALEKASSDVPALRVVIAQDGENAEAALAREGIDPDGEGLLVVIVFG